ncbi:hypothetical protein B5F40_11030 [Gordonibacter sp. An230]|uniref:TorD/DmsD family molecular chaperone n=1 Tax=Gordonibacter sp. An230 TaxID=1965592 RepID=UPI000B37C560|nr:molecular chaperone TorD family protein [Gordonibacter sp. An230]OUO89413.1 hypothetical protein B5F40_11030 [Gordonibacter sp. An230]
MTEELLSLEALLLARAWLYELFHKALGGAPTAELLELASSQATEDAADEYARPGNGMAELAALARGLRGRLGREELVERCAGEYNRLLVGLGRPGAPLWESAYSGEGALFGDGVFSVRKALAARGLRPKRRGSVPEDHASLLAGFMADSARRCLSALDCERAEEVARLLEEDATFASEHLGGWLCEAASLAGDGVFYPQMIAGLASLASADVTFAREGAAWLREAADGGRVLDGELPDEAREAFGSLRRELDRLAALRLPFLDEMELEPISANAIP